MSNQISRNHSGYYGYTQENSAPSSSSSTAPAHVPSGYQSAPPTGMPGSYRSNHASSAQRPATAPAPYAGARQYWNTVLSADPRDPRNPHDLNAALRNATSMVTALMDGAHAGYIREGTALARCNELRDLFRGTGTSHHIEAAIHAATHRTAEQQDAALLNRATDMIWSQGMSAQQAAQYIGAQGNPTSMQHLAAVESQRNAMIAQQQAGLPYHMPPGDDSPFAFN